MSRIITLISLLALVASQILAQAAPRSSTIIHDFESERVRVNLAPEVEYVKGTGLRLGRAKSSDYFRQGVITSWRDKAPLPFNEVVLSWNLDLPSGTGALVEIRALGDGGDSTAWYDMARIGKVPLPNERLKKDADGYINEDTLVLPRFYEWVEYRVTLYTDIPHHTPTLRLMAINYADTKNRIPWQPAPKAVGKQPWMRSLPVRWRSQLWEDKSISWRVCGPTSLSGALEFHGCRQTTADVSAAAWDDYNRMFGNWPFLAQAAASYGFKSYVIRCQDYEPIKKEIAAGRPVILSISFDKGEVTNAPFESTGGHIILCVGMTPDGDLICNDSGTRRNLFDHRVYKQEEIAKAWLARSAVAICVIPRSKNVER